MIWTKLRNYFIKGLLALLPLFITVYLIRFIFNFFDGFLGFGTIPGLGLVLSVSMILFTGFLVEHVAGRAILEWTEQAIFYRIPLVKSIYGAVRQVNDILFGQKNNPSSQRVCVVEYPRQGIYSVGFVTGGGYHEIEERAGDELVHIFVPNTPTPATGFLILVPKKDVFYLDIKFDEAMRFIVSGGVLTPKNMHGENKGGK